MVLMIMMNSNDDEAFPHQEVPYFTWLLIIFFEFKWVNFYFSMAAKFRRSYYYYYIKPSKTNLLLLLFFLNTLATISWDSSSSSSTDLRSVDLLILILAFYSFLWGRLRTISPTFGWCSGKTFLNLLHIKLSFFLSNLIYLILSFIVFKRFRVSLVTPVG